VELRSRGCRERLAERRLSWSPPLAWQEEVFGTDEILVSASVADFVFGGIVVVVGIGLV
jgi:hypothetical protein